MSEVTHYLYRIQPTRPAMLREGPSQAERWISTYQPAAGPPEPDEFNKWSIQEGAGRSTKMRRYRPSLSLRLKKSRRKP